MRLSVGVRRWFVWFTLAFALGGCASSPHGPADSVPGHHGDLRGDAHAAAWPLAPLVGLEGRRIGVPAQGGVRWLEMGALRAAWAAAQRVEAANPGGAIEYRLIDDARPNAFAMSFGGRGVVGINVGMMALLGDDEAAWAALIGHELAHLRLRHGDLQRSRQNETGGMVAVASVILTAFGFPLTPFFAELASNFADKGYSRADERAADEAGIEYMRRAGYDPAGAVRFFEKLAGTGTASRFTFLDTHPDSAERIAAARAMAER